jgi:hypothetical protein
MARGYQLGMPCACAKWLIVVGSSVTDACQNSGEFSAVFLRLKTIGF